MTFIKSINLVFILFIMSMGSISSLECRGGGGGGGGGHMGGGGFHGGGMGGHSMIRGMSHEMGHGNRNFNRNRGGGGGDGFFWGGGLWLDDGFVDGDDGYDDYDDVDLDDEIAGY